MKSRGLKKTVRLVAVIVFCLISMDLVAKTWTGGISTNWAEPGNWDPVGAPGVADDVVINGSYTYAPTLDLSGGAVTIASLSLGSSAVSVLTISFGDFDLKKLVVTGSCTIGPNGTLTHMRNVNVMIHRLFLDVGGNLDVVSGGRIDLNSKGFITSGPGGGTGWSPSHGGQGGSDARVNHGASYGSITEPSDLGSGGHGGLYGGGAVRLVVAGTLTVNGEIRANGSTYCAGGSIWISANTLSGTGAILANGSYGGGGRIALYYTTKNYTGVLTANANIQGAAGTIYEKPAAQTYGAVVADSNHDIAVYTYLFNSLDPSSVLRFASVTAKNKARIFVGANISADAYFTEGDGVIETWSDFDKLGVEPTVWWTGLVDTNWNTPGNWSTGVVPGENDVVVIEGCAYDLNNLPVVQVPVDANVTVRRLGVGNGAALTINAPFDELGNSRFVTISDVCLVSLGVLTHGGHVSGSQTEVNRLNLDVGGDIILYYLSRINVSGKGYNQAGPGYIANRPAYGGRGQNNSKTYGSIKQPLNLGSSRYAGSGGGGALKLRVAGTLINHGWIQSNGTSYSSGGSVWITVDTLSGGATGVISANGVYAGGGRVAVYYTVNEYAGEITARANSHPSLLASAGTVYTKADTQVHGTLSIDAKDVVTATDVAVSLNDFESVHYTFDEIIVTNSGRLLIDADDSITLAAGGTFQNSGDAATVEVLSGGSFTNAGTFVLSGTGAALTIDGVFTNEPGSVFRYTGTADRVDPVIVRHDLLYWGLEVEGPGQTFLWNAGQTYTVHEYFKATGAPGELAVLLSTVDGTAWYLNLISERGSGQHVRVKDSDAGVAKPVDVYPYPGWQTCVDEGGNVRWLFEPAAGAVLRFW